MTQQQRRRHKERSQLAHRAKFGFLEKHKDYVLRARDYHSKQSRIQRLKQKAANRNKDEFYFAMKNERTRDGVHVKDRGNTAMPIDMVKLLKSQDEGYIRTIKAVGLKKIDRIKRHLTDLANLVSSGHLVEDSERDEPLEETELETLRAAGVIASPGARERNKRHGPPKHVIFAEDAAEVQQHLARDADKGKINAVSTPLPRKLDLGWKVPTESVTSRRKKASIDDVTDPDEDLEEIEDVKHRKRLLKELAARLARDTQLSYALRELEMQRQLVGKGGRKRVRGAELVKDDDRDSDDHEDEDNGPRKHKSDPPVYKPRVYKWRIERKR